MANIERLKEMVKIRDRMIFFLMKERHQTEGFRKHHAAVEQEVLDGRKREAALQAEVFELKARLLKSGKE